MDTTPETYDVSEFLEQFRLSLQDQTTSAERNWAEDFKKYGQLCDAANKRLRECANLAQRAQYSNAVALAEGEQLLGRCLELDIQGSHLLPSIAQVKNIPVPTLLNRDLFAALQEAYERGNTAAGNQRLLHRLTLARAPMPCRLMIMRRMAAQNPNHPFLDTDIRNFERAWFRQAPDFAQPFVKQGRFEVIEEIVSDLEEGGFFETPPPSLVAQLKAQVAKAQATQLPALAKEIRQAFADESVGILMDLADRWKTIQGAAGKPSDDEKYGVTEALQWLAQVIDEKTKAAADAAARDLLSRLIQSHTTKRPDLVAAYEAARGRNVVDDALERQYRARLAVRGRTRIAVAVGIVVPLMCVSGVALIPKLLPPSPPSPLISTSTDSHSGSAGTGGVTPSPIPPVASQPVSVSTAGSPAPAAASSELDFKQRFTGLRNTSQQLLEQIRTRRAVGGRRGEIERLIQQHSALTKSKGSEELTKGELDDVQKTLDQIVRWRTLEDKFAGLKSELSRMKPTRGSLDRLAHFLVDEFSPYAPEPALEKRSGLARDSLPTWNKALEAQLTLQSASFPARRPNADAWKGHAPFELLMDAIAYSESLRQRDPTIEGTEASKLKKRLAERDIAGLWYVHQLGSGIYHYTTDRQGDKLAGNKVNALRNRDGQAINIPIMNPDKWTVERAPQSIYAERANVLWAGTGVRPASWDERLAGVYDALFDAALVDENKKRKSPMEPLLKLQLARQLLELAVRSSVEYGEILPQLPGYQKVKSIPAQIDGNWLNPGEALQVQRDRAEEFLEVAPRLQPFAVDAARRDEDRLRQLKQGLTLYGWLHRDEDGGPALMHFDGAELAAGSHLYTIENEKWVPLGSVAAVGGEPSLDEKAADNYLGWPIFALCWPPVMAK